MGVKSESQEGRNRFRRHVQLAPFGSTDGDGNQTLQGYPINAVIPSGTPSKPGGVQIFAISVLPIKIHRVIVTNIITHQSPMGDLIGILSHNGTDVVLNNHAPGEAVFNQCSSMMTAEKMTCPGQNPPMARAASGILPAPPAPANGY